MLIACSNKNLDAVDIAYGLIRVGNGDSLRKATATTHYRTAFLASANLTTARFPCISGNG